MRVIIAEDNRLEMDYLKSILSKENDIKIIGEASSGQEALDIISKLKADVAFLDISMPGISGMELAKKYGEKIFIVFVTAYNDLALDAFEVGAVDFILKPASEERVHLTLKRIRKSLDKKNKPSGKLSINTKRTILSIDISTIIFIEKVPLIKKVVINCENKELTVFGTLDLFEEKLRNYGFVRSHKSFIVNLEKIQSIVPWGTKSYLAKLRGTKKEALVSRNYIPLIKSRLNA